MGRKQKIIPHIPGTLDSIVEGFFANDKHIKAKKKEKSIKTNKEKDQAKTTEEERNAKDSNT